MEGNATPVTWHVNSRIPAHPKANLRHAYETANNSSNKTPANGRRAARAVCRDCGISHETLRQWSRRGWIKTSNTFSRKICETTRRYSEEILLGENA
jgi:hypothetical protein